MVCERLVLVVAALGVLAPGLVAVLAKLRLGARAAAGAARGVRAGGQRVLCRKVRRQRERGIRNRINSVSSTFVRQGASKWKVCPAEQQRRFGRYGGGVAVWRQLFATSFESAVLTVMGPRYSAPERAKRLQHC